MNPFAVFRKNQKVLMVVLTGLAMFAFVFLDAATQSGRLPAPLLGIMLGAGVFWIIGTQFGKPSEYALAGAIIGLAIGFVGQRFSGPTPAVESTIGNLSHRQVQELIQRRDTANHFVEAVSREAGQLFQPVDLQFGFGFPREQIDRDVVIGYLFRHEAEQMGLVVSDDSILDYLKQASQDKLDAETFKQIRRDMRLSESELFDVLRDELLAQRAFRLLAPRMHPTPEQYWDMYCKLNVQTELDVAAIPVARFVEQVEEPNPDDLLAFFEQNKTVFPEQNGPGTPGFRQPRKVRVAYLEADYDSFVKKVPEVSEQEIKDYYNENKEDLYRNRPLPIDDDETTTGTQSGGGLIGPTFPDGSPSSSDSPSSEAGEQPVTAPKPDSTPAPDSDAESGENQDAGDDSDAQANAAGQFAVADDEAEATETDAVDPDSAVAPQPPNEGPAVAPQPDDDQPSTSETTPLPEYRPLDDTLTAEIRDLLTRQRVLAAQKKAIEQAVNADDAIMFRLSDRFKTVEDKAAQKAIVPQIADELKIYAEEHGLHYEETDLLSYNELVETEEYPIGLATEPVPAGQEFRRVDARRVADMVFDDRPDQLFEPKIAEDSITSSWFAFWKVADVDSLVPSFDDKGIRDEVLTAWKQLKARDLAEARAKELVERVREARKDDPKKPLEDILLDETVTGDKEGLFLTTRPTPPFSWLRQTTAPPTSMGQQTFPPVLSDPVAVDNAGEEFMRVVFQELNVGDVGMAPNRDRSTFYVVHVRERIPNDLNDEIFRKKFLEERLFGSVFAQFDFRTPYDHLLGRDQQMLSAEWSRRLIDKYAVQWNDIDGPT